MDSPLVLDNNVTEATWKARFPSPYCTRALSPWEAQAAGLDPTEQQWIFTAPFRYVSDRFGPIDIPAGFTTDAASVPDKLQGIIGRTDRRILMPSAPHDWLYTTLGLTGQPLDPRTAELLGSQGLLAPGQKTRRLTKEQCDCLLVEAMWWMGAGAAIRSEVYQAVQLGGRRLWNSRCDEQGLPQFKA